MSNVDFKPLINYLKDKSILITSHCLVDLDGFVSCIILELFLRELNPEKLVKIYFPKISKTTLDFLEKFKTKFPDFKFKTSKEIINDNFNVLLILDTNNLDLIEEINEYTSKLPFIFIDHHLNLKKEYKMNLNTFNIINENYTSTAEIIFDIIESYEYILPIAYKYLLGSAIITDSLFLRNSNNTTLINLLKLLGDEIQYQDLIRLLNIPLDISERIAKIKGLQRVKLIRIKDWLIGISHASSYSAAIASMLINIGFDVSIVYSKEKTCYRISTRASKSICVETGLHLGKILNELGCGNGGGHEGAASLNITRNIENFLNDLLEAIKEILIKKKSL